MQAEGQETLGVGWGFLQFNATFDVPQTKGSLKPLLLNESLKQKKKGGGSLKSKVKNLTYATSSRIITSFI